MALRKSNEFLSIPNSFVVDAPEPANISYFWNFGSLLGTCLVIQLATGIFLAMHYSSNLDLAFLSVQHIMIDVNYGWLIRYAHANGAGFFFIFVYLHMARGIYYGSYRKPRVALWTIGVIIFVLMIATAFMGYCLVYGQMSHWGKVYLCASNIIILIFLLNIKIFLYYINFNNLNNNNKNNKYKIDNEIKNLLTFTPMPLDIISIIYGSLLGDGYGEKRYKTTRFSFYQEGSHEEYVLYKHNIISKFGYCSTNIPKITTRLGNNGKIRKIIRFNTWSLSKFNWIYSQWYINKDNRNIKILPKNINNYLTPLALAIWIMDDGGRVNNGLKLSTNNFSYEEVKILTNILIKKYNLIATIQKAGDKKGEQYVIYISPYSIEELYSIVKLYIVPSMKYKFSKIN